MSRKHSNTEPYKRPVLKEQGILFFKESLRCDTSGPVTDTHYLFQRRDFSACF